jgi:predicted N-formylglutamate amidohydrolase
LPAAEKARVLEGYWRAYGFAVRRMIEEQPAKATVVHIGVHTFTPVWKGRPRATDIGILFDPSRSGERGVGARWAELLRSHPTTSRLHIHRNRPYRGWTDGLVTTLRAEMSAGRYLGFELEVSQAMNPLREEIIAAIATTLRTALEPLASTAR